MDQGFSLWMVRRFSGPHLGDRAGGGPAGGAVGGGGAGPGGGPSTSHCSARAWRCSSCCRPCSACCWILGFRPSVEDPTPWLMGGRHRGPPVARARPPWRGPLRSSWRSPAPQRTCFCVGVGRGACGWHIGCSPGSAVSRPHCSLLLMARSLALVIIAWYAIGLLVYLAVGWRSDARASVAARRFVQLDLAGSALLLVSALVLLTRAPGLDVDVLRLAASPGAKSVLRVEGSVRGTARGVGWSS